MAKKEDYTKYVLVGSIVFLVIVCCALAYNFKKVEISGQAISDEVIETGMAVNVDNLPDTIGVYRPSTKKFFLSKSNNNPAVDIIVNMDNIMTSGDVPVVGDWNGDKYYTIGFYKNTTSTFRLLSENVPSSSITTVNFGIAGDVPVVGDWNGDGYDTIGVYRPTTKKAFMRNLNTNGSADISFLVSMAKTGDVPVVGDWNGDGYDTIGVYRPNTSTFFLRNSNTDGSADLTVTFGVNGDVPVVGDWNGDGIDTIGVYRPRSSTFFMKNANTNGAADLTVTFGVYGDSPVVGRWKENKFEEGIKCTFNKVGGVPPNNERCYSTDGKWGCNVNPTDECECSVPDGLCSCSCSTRVNGTYGTIINWLSSCGNGNYSTKIDGIPEGLVFNCGGLNNSISSNITKRIFLGSPIADDNSSWLGTFDKVIDKSKLKGLYNGTINFKGSDYRVREVLVSGQAPLFDGEQFVTVATSLTSFEDEYGTNVFLEAVRDSLKYYYVFDDVIKLSDIGVGNPLEINFLGRNLKITEITGPSSFTGQISYSNKVIALNVNDGDAYVGENPNDPDWIWNIGNLDVIDKTTIRTKGEFLGPYIGVENDFVYDDANDNPPGVGDCLKFPNNYISVCYDNLTVLDNRYAPYIFEYDPAADLDDAGYATYDMTSVGAIYIHTPVNEGIILHNSNFLNMSCGDLNMTYTPFLKDSNTTKVWVYADTRNSTGVAVFYSDINNKVRYLGSWFAGCRGLNFAHLNYGNSTGRERIVLDVDSGITNEGDVNLTLESFLNGGGDRVKMRWTIGPNYIDKLGLIVSSEEVGELQWDGGWRIPSIVNIGTKNVDLRSRYGNIIKNPRLNGARDSVVVDVPSDQVKAKITIKTGSN